MIVMRAVSGTETAQDHSRVTVISMCQLAKVNVRDLHRAIEFEFESCRCKKTDDQPLYSFLHSVDNWKPFDFTTGRKKTTIRNTWAWKRRDNSAKYFWADRQATQPWGHILFHRVDRKRRYLINKCGRQELAQEELSLPPRGNKFDWLGSVGWLLSVCRYLPECKVVRGGRSHMRRRGSS